MKGYPQIRYTSGSARPKPNWAKIGWAFLLGLSVIGLAACVKLGWLP